MLNQRRSLARRKNKLKKIFIIAGVLILLIIGLLIAKSFTGNSVNEGNFANEGDKLTIQVKIPCSGHAGLIKSELQNLDGIKSITFKGQNFFDVYYDSTKISPEKILGARIFQEYPAKIIK
ncbi:MAG: hypothetical protein Q7S06_01400 [Nanoarchaeota archaeon]|nr:hypothetical protein [Nanoarchaeota archaeon]